MRVGTIRCFHPFYVCALNLELEPAINRVNGLKLIIILNMSHLIINSPNKNKFALVSDQAQVELE